LAGKCINGNHFALFLERQQRFPVPVADDVFIESRQDDILKVPNQCTSTTMLAQSVPQADEITF
jgi:hypothetical protein